MKCECPSCGEIELDIKVGSGEANCPCGHIMTLTSRPEKYPGFNDWLKSFGLSELDQLGPVDQMLAAFNGGRMFEALQTLKLEKELENEHR